MFDKTSDLYVKTCVIQNGVTDTQGDTLDKVAIKQIFTSFNNQDTFEVHHEGIPIQGISLLENYISTTDEHIGDTLVPSGSWLIVMKVTCPQLQEQILNGVFGGVSLSNKVKSECACGLTGQIAYRDLESAECVIPMYISLVEAGANKVGLDIYNYEAYINKSKTGSVKLNLLDELKSLIQRAEDDSPVIEKSAGKEEETTTEEEDVVVESETVEKEPSEEVEPVIEKADNTKEDEDDGESTDSEEEPNVEKECNEEEAKIEKEDEPSISDLLTRIEALEKIVEELKPSEEAKVEKEDEATEDEVEEEEVAPVITKSAKVVITEQATEPKNDFYTRTGRDPITGKKL